MPQMTRCVSGCSRTIAGHRLEQVALAGERVEPLHVDEQVGRREMPSALPFRLLGLASWNVNDGATGG